MRQVIANGFPKSGNHALVKALQLLGVPARVNHAHEVQDEAGRPAQVPVVFIRRDPRNVVISWLRHQGLPVTPGMFLSHFRNWDQSLDPTAPNPFNGSLVAVMAPFEHWLTDPRALVVSYESLIASDREMRRIAEFCEVPYMAGAFDHLPGMTKTWSVKHSDWREVWNADVQNAWDAEGGPALLRRWGYA